MCELSPDGTAQTIQPPKSARFYSFKGDQEISLQVAGPVITIPVPGHDEEPAAIVCR